MANNVSDIRPMQTNTPKAPRLITGSLIALAAAGTLTLTACAPTGSGASGPVGAGTPAVAQQQARFAYIFESVEGARPATLADMVGEWQWQAPGNSGALVAPVSFVSPDLGIGLATQPGFVVIAKSVGGCFTLEGPMVIDEAGAVVFSGLQLVDSGNCPRPEVFNPNSEGNSDPVLTGSVARLKIDEIDEFDAPVGYETGTVEPLRLGAFTDVAVDADGDLWFYASVGDKARGGLWHLTRTDGS